MKKKLYYVSEPLTESIGEYIYVSEYKNLRVYEIINGELIEFCNREYFHENTALGELTECLEDIHYNKDLDESTYNENDYEFIEL